MSYVQDRINELLLKRLEAEEAEKEKERLYAIQRMQWNAEYMARKERERAEARAYRLANPDAWVACPRCGGDGHEGGSSTSACGHCNGRRVIRAKYYRE